ncbi:radical SAM/SPASM domain-containing protein [Mucilaginibacter sp. KACC 22063]|uniref:radical SAM/SPASM domain-containing protein n=1 Tax=Mucilaginibacter sp. KACC 22063 TaxID=3025666 RepID=UPI002366D644|nr:radical SAM protein [Mucilaginibacter sp. KACC 22063]WDF56224.1 radical SAM protein [Mucilaginibacter sp. KACC 22063]
MIELDWETGLMLSKLNSMEIHYLDTNVIDTLIYNGMIISKNIDEFDAVAERANSNREICEQSDTLFMVISPTNTCNMNCPYCYQGDKTPTNSDTKYLGEENMEALKKMIAKVVYEPHATPITKIRIEWFGGEPLIRKKVIEEFSDFVINLATANNIDYRASIITNGTLLDAKTYEILEKCKVENIQITIDGSKKMHDSLRFYISGKGTYDKIMENLALMPPDKFKVTIRINGDKAVFDNLDEMFNDFEENGLWPQRANEINYEWAPKFYNFLGYNQDKDVYYTSYQYQKSKEDFALLKLKKYNEWANKNGFKNKKLRVAYPSFAEFYCGTVESPNSISVDDGGYLHKCYNTINDKSHRTQHVTDFDPYGSGMDHYKKFDKTKAADCRTCKVLPICEESCNMRFVSNAESKVCSGWKYFMDERIVAIYEQSFSTDETEKIIASRTGSVETC